MSNEAVPVKVTMLADVCNLGNFRNTLGKEELSLITSRVTVRSNGGAQGQSGSICWATEIT
jgi:hypothetical protein